MRKVIFFTSLTLAMPAMAQNTPMPTSCPGIADALNTCQTFDCYFKPVQIAHVFESMADGVSGKKLSPEEKAEIDSKIPVFHYSVRPMQQGSCEFKDIQGQVTATCNLNAQQRVDLSGFFRQLYGATETESGVSGALGGPMQHHTLKLDGKPTRDVYSELVDNGTCKAKTAP